MFWQQQQSVCNNLLPWYKWHDYTTVRFKFQIGKLLTIVTPRAGYTQNCTIAYRGLLYYFINNRLWLKNVYVFIINHYNFTPYSNNICKVLYHSVWWARIRADHTRKGAYSTSKKKKNSLRNRGPAARSHMIAIHNKLCILRALSSP